MPNARNQNEKRLFSEGQNSSHYDPSTRPLSLSCGPILTWLYLHDDPEAIDIVEGFRPRFEVRQATAKEMQEWFAW